MIYAVDFDGTLCIDAYPEIGAPNNMIIEHIKYLKSQGHRIVLWTCRTGKYLNDAVQWCSSHNIMFDAINQNVSENIAEYGTDCRKVYADFYLDDKCLPINHHTILNNNCSEIDILTSISGDYETIKNILLNFVKTKPFENFTNWYGITKFPDLTFTEQNCLYQEISQLLLSYSVLV